MGADGAEWRCRRVVTADYGRVSLLARVLVVCLFSGPLKGAAAGKVELTGED